MLSNERYPVRKADLCRPGRAARDGQVETLRLAIYAKVPGWAGFYEKLGYTQRAVLGYKGESASIICFNKVLTA